MSEEEKPSSVTLNLIATTVSQPTVGKYLATVTMLASFEDMDLWEQVRKKLDGMEVRQGETLMTEALSMLEDQVSAGKQRVEDITEEFRAYRETAESEKSFMEAELRRLKELESQLGRLSRLDVPKVVD